MKHKIEDECGYWYKGYVTKSLMGRLYEINEDNIDELIERFQDEIVPWKPVICECYQPIVDGLKELKIKIEKNK
jgi:FMN phosphatase YigB (HAD superfamily)